MCKVSLFKTVFMPVLFQYSYVYNTITMCYYFSSNKSTAERWNPIFNVLPFSFFTVMLPKITVTVRCEAKGANQLQLQFFFGWKVSVWFWYSQYVPVEYVNELLTSIVCSLFADCSVYCIHRKRSSYSWHDILMLLKKIENFQLNAIYYCFLDKQN